MPTKADDDAAFWDALYEKEVPPSTWDDHRDLDEAPGDNFAPWGADKDAGARLQIGGLDQRYQADIDDVVAKLTAVEADPKLAKYASREALMWLGDNTALLGYFFGGTAASIIGNAPDRPGRPHRGMYQPPQASDDALAARRMLHSRLMALIANEDVGTATNDATELRTALDRIVWIVRANYLDHLGFRFAETKNPTFAWHAVRLALNHNLVFPEWLSGYLSSCAKRIYEAGKKNSTATSHTDVLDMLGFIDRGHSNVSGKKNSLYGRISDVETEAKMASIYKIAHPRDGLYAGGDSIKIAGADKEIIGETTASTYVKVFSKRIPTNKPYDQDL